MIVDAFEEALEKGLSEWDQCVVSSIDSYNDCNAATHPLLRIFRGLHLGEPYIPLADVPDLGIRLTNWQRDW